MSSSSTPSLLPLLSSLPLSHPSFLPLVESHKPFAHPSHLSQSQLTKLLNRLNSLILSRNDDLERKASFQLAQVLVQQDTEGWTLGQYGKGWVGACLSLLASPTTTADTIQSPLALLQTIVLSSSSYPALEREAVHPIMGKLSVTLGKLLERTLADEQREWTVILYILGSIRTLLLHSPANFRPLVPTLQTTLYILVLQIPVPPFYFSTVPEQVQRAAADLLAALHVTAGKAQSPAAWGTAMRDSLGGIGRSVAVITSEAWEEEAIRVAPPAAPAGLPDLPADPLARLSIALDWLEGYVEAALALLRFPTSRPVPVPIAQLVAAGLRCLNLTLDTPTVSYISPQHHAALLASLPRIWSAGIQLIGAVALSCGDHLFPHLSTILDHTIWLVERLPGSMTDSQTQLLRFHHLLLTLYPPALMPIDYPTRLLKFSLAQCSPLMDNRPSAATANGTSSNGGGKRGKKRARGAEDGLVGGLEGREGQSLSEEECIVILAALKLTILLHTTPLLSPALLNFSIRLHLSLHLTLQDTPSSAFASPSSLARFQGAVSGVLKAAALLSEGESGTARGYKNLIYAVLSEDLDKLAPIIHPSVPPLLRPLPPLSALHLFAPESDEEKRLRRELGFSTAQEAQDADVPVSEGGDAGMDVDQESRIGAPVGQPAIKAAAAAFGSIAPAPAPVPAVLPSAPAVLPQATSQPSALTPQAQAQPQPRSPDQNPQLPPQAVREPSTIPSAGSFTQTEIVDELISRPLVPTSTSTSKTTLEAKTKAIAQVSDEGEDSDGPLPDLDSGSDDDMLDEDDDEE